MSQPTLYPVHIVGAGPGDPDLLTVKALRLIRQADAVVYDRLVPDAIIDLIPKGVVRFFAGKSCKQHFMTQDEINELLVTLARKGKRVVRLKGGDPFIFGRAGEEAEHLIRHNIAFDIVPGISSASGCTAYAGIPLTHRGLATGVRFITGHAQKGQGVPDYDWKTLADEYTTLVIYMGLANLQHVSDSLRAGGLADDFPAAAIEKGTTPQQRVLVSTLKNLPQDVLAQQFESPTLVIVGRVVSVRERLFGSAGSDDAARHDHNKKQAANKR